jgi:hypothetical protein
MSLVPTFKPIAISTTAVAVPKKAVTFTKLYTYTAPCSGRKPGLPESKTNSYDHKNFSMLPTREAGKLGGPGKIRQAA